MDCNENHGCSRKWDCFHVPVVCMDLAAAISAEKRLEAKHSILIIIIAKL